VRGVADVLVDESGRLGALSYLVPDELEVHVGDAVEVPFGKRTSRGLVLGPGQPAKATRPLTRVYGPRASAGEIDLAREIARRNFSTFEVVAARLAPRTKRGNPPLRPGRVAVRAGDGFDELGRRSEDAVHTRRVLACAPLVDMVRLAALEAAEMSKRGQVLVLCPTKSVVGAVFAEFTGGAGRLDVTPREGEPSAWRAFLDGTLRVGVATRTSALWAAPNLVGIIVVDENHPGHIESVQPHTNARDVAAARTLRSGAELVILSDNPSPGSLGVRAKVHAVGGHEHWPAMVVLERPSIARHAIDLPKGLRGILDEWRSKGVSPLGVTGASEAVARCKTCKSSIWCDECKKSACTHLSSWTCPGCEGNDYRLYGWSAPRVAKALGKGARACAAFDLREHSDEGLVVVYDADAFVGSAELIAGRRLSGVLLAAARAAGRGGQLVVVTSDPSDAVIDDLVVRCDLVRAAKRTWAAARDSELPPFGRLVSLRVKADKPPRIVGWPGKVLGPRSVGDGEFEILVRCGDGDLDEVGRCVDRLRKRAKVRVSVS
jgi:hypothetical protein